MMNSPLAYRRLTLLGSFTVLCFVALGAWVAHVQIEQHEPLALLAQANNQRKAVRPSRRGSIRDVRGSLLATSVPVKTVCADPSLLWGQQALVARTLAPCLGVDEGRLLQQLQPQLRTNAAGRPFTNAYVVLTRKLPLPQWQQATQAMSRLSIGVDERKLRPRQQQALRALREKAVFGQDDQWRQYPGHSLAAHLLGFVSSDDLEDERGRVTETHGVTGVELAWDKVLNGVHGWCDGGEEVAAQPGLEVVLTLDAGVQNIVEAELEKAMQQFSPESLSAIVLQPRSGRLLALANLPTFDANRPSAYPVATLRNRALADPSEPGSTFKAMVVAGALDARVVTLDDQFDCEQGQFAYAGRILHDHESYGLLTVEQIITKSSNIGAAKIGIKMGESRLHDYITRFGFGARTGIELAGESRGYLRPAADWEKLSISRIPMGHELLVTPMQMMMAISAIANDGRLMRPMLVDRLQDEQGNLVKRFEPQVIRQVVSPAAAREMVKALKTVVTPAGTAAQARLEHYTVAGKTGTAERFVNGTYKSGYYFSSFAGFFPADEPELCVLVVFDNLHDPDRRKGHYGGKVAGPVFRAIGEKVAAYLRVAPEGPLEARPEAPARRPARPGPVLAGETAFMALPGSAPARSASR